MLLITTLLQIPSDTFLPMLPRVSGLASTPWAGLVIFISLLSLITVFSVNRNHYIAQLHNMKSSRARTMIYHVEQTSFLADIFLWIVVVLCFSLFAYSFYKIYNAGSDIGILHFLYIILLSASALGLKWLLFFILGNVLNLKEKQANYSRSYFIATALLAIVLMLLTIAVIYMPRMSSITFYSVAILLYALFLIFVLFKVIQIFYEGLGTLFYIFLYLCTLEIMPTMLVLKVASMV